MAVVCFGEMLWDELPGGRQPGGAPLNVAAHLHQLGQPAELISRVGADAAGAGLLNFLVGRGLSGAFVQTDTAQPTGLARADVRDPQAVSYDLVRPAAWDFIAPVPVLRLLVRLADALVFGSLAARDPASRATLLGLLPEARWRVFDVNLRPPHYTRETVGLLLSQSDLVKMNEAELAEILAWHAPTQYQAPPDETALPALAARYGLAAVCVTRGAAGDWYWVGGQLHRSAGSRVAVRDTIGSGDAFLAALLTGWLGGRPPAECLALADAAGALVATRVGATPCFTPADLARLLAAEVQEWKRQLYRYPKR